MQTANEVSPNQRAHTAELSVGNRVRLNSGGPDAVIVDRNGNDIVIQWLGHEGKTERSTLPAACVQLIPS